MILRNIAIIRNAAPQDFGGGERFPVFLASVLAKQGYNPLLISRSRSLLQFAKSQNIPYLKGWWLKKQNWSGVSYLLTPLYVLWQTALTLSYLRIFITKKIDIVHIQSKDDFIAATIAGHLLKKRIIWTDHADLKHILLNTGRPLRNPTGKLVLWAMRYADTITVVSESELLLVRDHIQSSPALIEKLRVVYNGAFDHFPKPKDTPKDGVRILFAGRIVRDKGIGETIEALKLTHHAHPEVSLDIIGDGPEFKTYQSIASDLPFITFHGHQSDPVTWMSKADIFILPTYHEGFSLALVEASMMQLAIVATEVGGNPEIINSQTGILIPSHDIQALTEAINQLVTNPKLRITLAANAREQYIEKFQFDRIVKEQFIPLYEKNSH